MQIYFRLGNNYKPLCIVSNFYLLNVSETLQKRFVLFCQKQYKKKPNVRDIKSNKHINCRKSILHTQKPIEHLIYEECYLELEILILNFHFL